jgi:hypothetical protein
MFTASFFLMILVAAHPAFSLIENVGQPVTISGIVYDCNSAGSGIQIDAGDEIVTVFGKGPAWYWDQQEVELPGIGDTVTVYAYEIMFSDETTKLVAGSIDVDGDGLSDIALRDEDGNPLWRQHGKNIFRHQTQASAQTQARRGTH